MNWTNFLIGTLIVGAVATVASTVAVVAATAKERKTPYAGVQAVSHIAYGEKAIGQDNYRPQYFWTGFGLNTGAMLGWAAVFEGGRRLLGWNEPSSIGLLAVGVTVLAYVVDFHVVPKRLTPGFERVVSQPTLLAIYGILATSIWLGGLGSSALT